MDLSLLELAYAHLGKHGHYQLKDGHIESILPIALSEINHVRSNNYSKNYVPIVGSFGVIEQIGFSYKRTDMSSYTNENASPINKALYYFAGFSEDADEIKVLYALRNSFLHSASLMSKALHKNKPSYYFRFDREISNILQNPTAMWNGDIETFQSGLHQTIINPEKIIDLAFNIRNKAIECLENEVLEVALEGGERELYYRYLKHTAV